MTPGLLATSLRDSVINFAIGAGWGAAAVALVITAYVVARRQRWLTPVPVAGVLLAAAALAAMNGVRNGVPGSLVLGVAVVAGGGAIVVRRGPSVVRVAAALARVVVIAVGAAIVAGRTDIPGPSWVRIAVAGTIVVAGLAASDLDRRAARAGLGLGPVLVLATAAGIFATVPDTEYAAAFLGAAAAVAIVGWPYPAASLGPAAPAVVAVAAWIGAVDGRGRPGAVIGALACWALFVAEPAGRLLSVSSAGLVDRVAQLRPRLLATPAVLVLHVGLVSVCSRVAGLHEQRDEAATVAAVALGGATVVSALVARLVPAPRQTAQAPSPAEAPG